jgi:predicted phosphodiesterase
LCVFLTSTALHGQTLDIPDDDIFIHGGDSLGQGSLDNLEELNEWLDALPHRQKNVIAGNPGCKDWAFMLNRGQLLVEKWALIPDNTNVLITHDSLKGSDDLTNLGSQCRNAGYEQLCNRVQQLSRLKVHVFGHIHAGYGQYRLGETRPINASTSTLR